MKTFAVTVTLILMLGVSGFSQEPIYLGGHFSHTLRNGRFYAYTPALLQTNSPVGANQVLVAAWKAANLAGQPGAIAVSFSMLGAPSANPSNANQVLTDVWDEANNALTVYCIQGCSGTGDVIGTFTTNRIPKGTAAHTLGDSQITDTGSLITLPGAVTVRGSLVAAGTGVTPSSGPGAIVDIWGADGGSTPFLRGVINGVNVPFQITPTAGNLVSYSFQNGNSMQGFFQSTAANVGIGTDTPTNKLDVSGAASVAYGNAVAFQPTALTGTNSCGVDTNANCIGVNGAATLGAGSLTLGILAGVLGQADASLASTLDETVGVMAIPGSTTGLATIGANYGLHVHGDANNGAALMAGIKVDDQTGSSKALVTGAGEVNFGGGGFIYAPVTASNSGGGMLSLGNDVSGDIFANVGSVLELNGHLGNASTDGSGNINLNSTLAVDFSDNNTISSVYGGKFLLQAENTNGTITTAVGLTVENDVAPSMAGVVANGIGLQVAVGQSGPAPTSLIGISIGDIAGATTNYVLKAGTGKVEFDDLKTTGAATGKTVVCVDTATGILYASTSGVACAN